MDLLENPGVLGPLAFVAGAVIGSFLNVVASRVPADTSIVMPPSQCPHCKAKVKAYDNIPILSWLILRGRCRNCRTPISPRYVLVELGTAILFCGYALKTGLEPQLALGLPLIATLAVVAVTDIEHRLVPNPVLLASTMAALVASLYVDAGHIPTQLIAAAAAGGLLLLTAVAYPAGMGMGDVKLAAVLGLYLGKEVAPALLLGIAAGAFFGIALILKEGKSARKKAVPFAPFLALGGLLALYWGSDMLDWYSDNILS